MPNFNQLNKLFNKYNKMVGEISGDLFDIYRPDYSIVDNLPVKIHDDKRYRLDPTGAERYVEPQFTNVEYYDIFGNRKLPQTGDIFYKGSDLSNPDITTPAVTLLHTHPIKAMIGMRTSRRGHIVINQKSDSTYNYIYENVFFEFIQEGFIAGAINTKIMNQSSTDRPAQQAVMYHRPNLNREGLQLIEANSDWTPNGDKWLIQAITHSGPVTILTLVANYRR